VNVALVLDDTLDRPDGVQQYVLTLGQWLAGRGHKVHYLVADSKRDDIANVHSLGRYFSTSFNGNSVRTPLPASRAKIRHVLGEVRPDVLHVQMPYSPLLAGRVIATAGAGTAVVGTFHVLPVGTWHGAANRVLGWVLRQTLGRFAVVMAVSQPAANFARQVYRVHPVVVPNVVEVRKFERAGMKKSDDSHVTVKFLGRLVERKGVLQLIQAWQALPVQTRRRAKLVIGGRGPLAGRARAMAGDDEAISFAGFVPEADKPDFFAQADVACFPSTGGESFGIILVEAMAAGAGVVLGGNNPGYASVLGGQPESLVAPNETAQFAKQLAHFIDDAQARRSLHREQQKLAKRYDVEEVGPEIERLYERAAGGILNSAKTRVPGEF
jgi:phosphatidylinositol alpha-mannosyltransferase